MSTEKSNRITNNKITGQMIQEHGLSPDEYQKILEILDREPNLLELGVFSVMWSEHCSYKSSRLHLKKLPTEGPQVIQGPGENAGVVDIGDGDAIVFKMESHNHPSFIEPYQGAATGVGGIMRDVFTMGARPIANLNSLRFGAATHPKTASLVSGVVAGIAGYGNCMGVPTVGGETFFDASYNGNILVNAMTVGLIKSDKIFKGKAEGTGNPVLYVGSKTGRDGIHGATMASAEFDEDSEEKRPTVQVGDPFTEKLLLEACLEVMKEDWLVGIQDMGAAGLTSSSFEMASRAGSGIRMDLSQVPTREREMTPYELMLSESQERMLLVAKQGCEDKVVQVFEKWDLDAVVVGEVTDDGHMTLLFNEEQVARLPISPLVDASPIYDRPSACPAGRNPVNKTSEEDILSQIAEPDDFNAVLLKMLASPNLSSRRWIYRQYDHMVMTNTLVQPGSDAAVVRIKGTQKAVAMTTDCNSRYVWADPYEGAKLAVCEAYRNLTCSGAKPLATTDCLNFASPEREETMWEFKEALKGLGEACVKLDAPIIGGNVSFYNETEGVGVFPTPTLGMVGLIPDASKVLQSGFKNLGDTVALLGKARGYLGVSEYLNVIHGSRIGRPCPSDLKQEILINQFISSANQDALLNSAHDVSDGGLVVALAESCLSSCCPSPKHSNHNMAVKIQFDLWGRLDQSFFSEGPGQVILSFDPKSAAELKSLAENLNLDFTILGQVQEERFQINSEIDLSMSELNDVWSQGLEKELFECVES